ncbi:amidohydrolase family protein [Rhodopirellula europaea]|uniref:Amidohydrolase 2 n=1 Tax=Rhodopirellula europaea 6C TaxID=1263867 RepID=M2AUA0_9BACT|nr:amidohydrolase family protein [Rhodopirellula europaea]EMB16297.1 Amidohydrolase 2 [Rhodopirellula europaea 6C]
MTLRRLLLLFAWVGASLLMQAATAQKPSELHAVVKTRGSMKPIQKSRDDRATSVESHQADETPLDGRDGRDLSVHHYNPKSQLKTKVTDVKHAAFPVVNVHTHFFYRLRLNRDALEDFVGAMDRNHIAVCVSLDGKLGTQFQEQKDYLWKEHRGRFVLYANIDWRGDGASDDPATWACYRPGFAERTVEQLREAVEQGASGLKLFKRFGLGYRYPDGSLMKIDDPRWDPIWAACGELQIPIIIHTADPAAFFDPIDERNERWEELSRHPDWSFHGDEFPSREELFAARNRMIAKHPNTQFIGAHIANNPEDLATVSEWMDQYPNLWLEPASRINELGRQPRAAREFLIRYQDRLLFGTDGPWPEQRLRYYWRFFETDDEAFPYSEKEPPPQGLWQIDGVNLPPKVLRKLYYENAVKLIPGVRERVEAFAKQHSLD